MDFTDVQWAVLEPTFRPRRRPDGRGRPWNDPRAVMNGVLRVLRTGAPWHDLLMTHYGIEMIAANRRGPAKTQDGRPLRRAKRRWNIERLFPWLHNWPGPMPEGSAAERSAMRSHRLGTWHSICAPSPVRRRQLTRT